MHNVPSSAILAIISIAAAVLVGTFALSMFYSAQDSGMQLSRDANQQMIALSSDLNVENGEKLSGSQVKSCIQTNEHEEVAIQVKNGDEDPVSFYYRLDSDNEVLEKLDSTDAKRAMLDKNQTKYYINPSDVYTAQFLFGEKTGNLTGVLFIKADAAKRNQTDRKQEGVREDISVRTITITLDPAGGTFENPGDDWETQENGNISRTFLSSDTGNFTLPVPVKANGTSDDGSAEYDVFLGWYNDTQAASKNVVIDMGDASFGKTENQEITYTAKWENGKKGYGTYEIQYFFMDKNGEYQNTPNLTLEAGNTANGYIVRTSGELVNPNQQNFEDDHSEEAKAYKSKFALYQNGDYIFDAENPKNILQGTVSGKGLALKVYFKRCYSVQLLSKSTGLFEDKLWRGYGTVQYINENGDVLNPDILTDEEKQRYKQISYSDTDTSVKIPYGEDPESYIRHAVGNVTFTESIPKWDDIMQAVKALPDFPDITEDSEGKVEITDRIIEYAAQLPTFEAARS